MLLFPGSLGPGVRKAPRRRDEGVAIFLIALGRVAASGIGSRALAVPAVDPFTVGLLGRYLQWDRPA